MLAVALIALHACAAAALMLVFSGIAAIALALAFLGLGMAAAWSRALLKSPRSVRAIELAAEAHATLEFANGESTSVEIAARRFVSRYLVTLPLRGRLRRSLIITRDMLGPNEFRRLRIWALWGRLPGVALPQLPA